MKEQFINKNFSSRSLELIAVANAICESYAQRGYDLSLRQLYYQFVANHGYANSEANYKKLGGVLADARMAGLLDWDYIKDRSRETMRNSHWDNPGQILSAVATQFRIDSWQDQPRYVEVMVEKQALEGILIPVCSKLDISFTANKGYSSASAMYETAQRLLNKRNAGAETHIIYLGDHDPSGIDMTRDVEERLCLLSDGEVTVHRIALNMDQVRQYNPPENPAKLTDSRSDSYIERFGDSSWELDALSPEILTQLVEDAVLELRDDDIQRPFLAQQKRWRDELLELACAY
jgi:hypothetical protein